MKLSFRLFFALFLNLIYIAIMVWIGYSVWTKQASIFFIIALIAMLLRWPDMLTGYSRFATEDDHFSIDLSVNPAINKRVTPEFIREILADEKVMQVIKNDLAKTGQIGYREEWRLGLLTPDQVISGNITPARTAVLQSRDYFKRNNVAITNGTNLPAGFSKWGRNSIHGSNSGLPMSWPRRGWARGASYRRLRQRCTAIPGLCRLPRTWRLRRS